MAYDLNGEGGRTIIESFGMPDGIELSRRLDEREISAFDRLLNDTASYGGLTGACFDPHLRLVYSRNGTIQAHISICLACNNIRSSVEVPAMEHASHRIRVEDGEDYYAKGFSMRARQELSERCNALGFDHCELRGPKGRYQR